MRELDVEELCRAVLQWLGHGQLLLFGTREELVAEFDHRFQRMVTRFDMVLPPNKEWKPIPLPKIMKAETADG